MTASRLLAGPKCELQGADARNVEWKIQHAERSHLMGLRQLRTLAITGTSTEEEALDTAANLANRENLSPVMTAELDLLVRASLLPLEECPCCGSTVDVGALSALSYGVECDRNEGGCGLKMEQELSDAFGITPWIALQMAITRWNRRGEF